MTTTQAMPDHLMSKIASVATDLAAGSSVTSSLFAGTFLFFLIEHPEATADFLDRGAEVLSDYNLELPADGALS
ncbi:hypothetical protein QOZ96_003379 [Brevundimonas nasdae]|uniref:Cytochrome P450 n=1 Tax=Brevundimonas nasdae TaxID=172043 RepID=A0ABX8TME6_9CAUL|nr:hypothetical protein [Brevundimonas nasdae]MBK6026784.1 hypothetical protein [Brevundimonas nasdae]MDQ0453409.1 hypothetical protein [Brevundimonas nasdae]QYC12406.1 hypothetical protein KWG56_18355 [Brevundimonas nasdae]